jgi:hypothetical protein
MITEKYRLLSNCDCFLQTTIDGRPEALHIGEKEKFSSFSSENDGFMVIRPLDSIIVDVTSTTTAYNVVGTIQVHFVGPARLAETKGKTEGSPAVDLSEVVKLILPTSTSCKTEVEECNIGKVLRGGSAPYPNSAGLCEIFSRKCWRDDRLYGSERSFATRSNVMEMIGKIGRRRDIVAGGFRLVFGSVTQQPPMKSADISGDDMPYVRSYAHARQRMLEMGETWAEEEELPDTTIDESESNGGINAAAKYGKLQHLATQRIGKLKSEKRSSKY